MYRPLVICEAKVFGYPVSDAEDNTQTSSCNIQADTDYYGYDVGIGGGILSLGSCQYFCESKYPTTTYFTYVNSNCHCKSSNAGAVGAPGLISGELSCPGNMREIQGETGG